MLNLKLSKNDGVLDPPPDEIDLVNNTKMWIIKDYKIWANSYQEALEMLPMIENSSSIFYAKD